MKTLLKFLRIWDGLWSVPLSVFLFLLASYIGHLIFGNGFATYDPATFQAAILAATLMAGANVIVQFAFKFNFPTLWEVYHTSFSQHFYSISPWKKICCVLFMYCFFFVLFIVLFLKLA